MATRHSEGIEKMEKNMERIHYIFYYKPNSRLPNLNDNKEMLVAGPGNVRNSPKYTLGIQ